MKCSDLAESASAIFAATAGKSSRIKICRANGQPGDAQPWDFSWSAGPAFAAVASPCDFNFCPRARCALRLGEGPRAVGFSISMPGILTLFFPLAPNRKTKSAIPEQEQENEQESPTLA
jgi:hypothetical protein